MKTVNHDHKTCKGNNTLNFGGKYMKKNSSIQHCFVHNCLLRRVTLSLFGVSSLFLAGAFLALFLGGVAISDSTSSLGPALAELFKSSALVVETAESFSVLHFPCLLRAT